MLAIQDDALQLHLVRYPLQIVAEYVLSHLLEFYLSLLLKLKLAIKIEMEKLVNSIALAHDLEVEFKYTNEFIPGMFQVALFQENILRNLAFNLCCCMDHG